jgi:tetratricopeptide (TPR) repeat protein
MQVDPKTAENLKSINEAIASKNDENLRDILIGIGIEGLLNPDLMHLARGSHSEPAVMLLATIGKENAKDHDRQALILELYQAIVVHKSSSIIIGRPKRHLLNQVVDAILTKSSDINFQTYEIGTIIHDWIDAIELAIDFENPALAENIIQALLSYNPEVNVFLNLKYRITQRFSLIKNEIDWNAFARCLGLLHDGLSDPEWDDEKQDLLLYIMEASYKARNWDAIIGIKPLMHRPSLGPFSAYRCAEAYCQKGLYIEAVENADQHINLYIENKLNDGNLINDGRPTGVISEENDSKIEVEFSSELAGKALAELSEILDSVGNKMFLVSGTLLGYARTGSVLPHDKDIDVGIFGWESQYDIIQAIINSKKFGIFPTYVNGHLAHQLPVFHLETGMTIDMFIYHIEGQKFITGVNPPWGYIQRFEFSPFLLKEVDFLGIKVQVPADIDKNLTENFGNWRLPIPNYVSHVESPSTVGQGELLHLLVCRLNLIEALYKKKPGRIVRIISVLDQYRNRPGHIEDNLRDILLNYSNKLDSDQPKIKLAV